MKGASSTHQDEVLAEEQKTYTLSYITHTLILLIIVDCHNYLHEHSNSSKHEVW